MSMRRTKRGEKTIQSHAYTFKGQKVLIEITSNHAGGYITIPETGKVVLEGTINELLAWVAARQTWRQALTLAFTSHKINEKVYDAELARLTCHEENVKLANALKRGKDSE